ncbi:hypothetical protein H5410_056128 [Solanum commersonii]|uniref:Uncharacterized protein n=1 Tax=Solanum commersonii TaxID=4109 RepID=A0A9J5WKD3_SOLCO|nr:hypothetical protein H5410_056128 [Solanum commersonii]
MGCTPLVHEVFKKIHVKKKENESDPDVWAEERTEQTFYVNENLDSSVQLIPELSSQIWTKKVVGGHTRVESMASMEPNQQKVH